MTITREELAQMLCSGHPLHDAMAGVCATCRRSAEKIWPFFEKVQQENEQLRYSMSDQAALKHETMIQAIKECDRLEQENADLRAAVKEMRAEEEANVHLRWRVAELQQENEQLRSAHDNGGCVYRVVADRETVRVQQLERELAEYRDPRVWMKVEDANRVLAEERSWVKNLEEAEDDLRAQVERWEKIAHQQNDARHRLQKKNADLCTLLNDTRKFLPPCQCDDPYPGYKCGACGLARRIADEMGESNG